jgi:hypothetical protein
LALVAIKAAVSAGMLWSGFRSISDDDFARVTIAQTFARHPSLDPSGTSWLPLPFWVYGGAMTCFGSAITTARVTAVVLGVAAVLLVWRAARALESSRPAAFIAAVLAACVPHSAYYGTAMVPDYPTAALALFAAATMASRRPTSRLLGAGAACAATLCRYETWPIAIATLVFAGFDAFNTWRGGHRSEATRGSPEFPDPRPYLAAALIAPSGIIAWLLHGVWHHGNALFFVKRVAAYRRALGGSALDATARLLKVPTAIVRGEPELTVLLLATFAAVGFCLGRSGWRGRGWMRPAIALLSLAAFLIIGDWLDGAPTHHEDRTLLSIWLGMTLLIGELASRCWFVGDTEAHDTTRRRVAFGAVACATLATAALRSHVVPNEPFVDRELEVAIGEIARLVVPPEENVAVYTEDFGYFAVLAALGRPKAFPLSRHDPREKLADPLSNADTLRENLKTKNARFLIVPKSRRAALPMKTEWLGEAGEFQLLHIQ